MWGTVVLSTTRKEPDYARGREILGLLQDQQAKSRFRQRCALIEKYDRPYR